MNANQLSVIRSANLPEPLQSHFASHSDERAAVALADNPYLSVDTWRTLARRPCRHSFIADRLAGQTHTRDNLAWFHETVADNTAKTVAIETWGITDDVAEILAHSPMNWTTTEYLLGRTDISMKLRFHVLPYATPATRISWGVAAAAGRTGGDPGRTWGGDPSLGYLDQTHTSHLGRPGPHPTTTIDDALDTYLVDQPPAPGRELRWVLTHPAATVEHLDRIRRWTLTAPLNDATALIRGPAAAMLHARSRVRSVGVTADLHDIAGDELASTYAWIRSLRAERDHAPTSPTHVWSMWRLAINANFDIKMIGDKKSLAEIADEGPRQVRDRIERTGGHRTQSGRLAVRTADPRTVMPVELDFLTETEEDDIGAWISGELGPAPDVWWAFIDLVADSPGPIGDIVETARRVVI